MNKYLMLLISSFILNIGGIYSCYKIQNKKISLKNYKLYIAYKSERMYFKCSNYGVNNYSCRINIFRCNSSY